MNLVILNGNVGVDPTTKQFENGFSVTTFTLATNKTYVTKEEKRITNTQWHTIKVFNKLGLTAEKFIKKGDKVLIQGEIKYDSYEKDGVNHTLAFIECDKYQKQNFDSQSESPVLDSQNTASDNIIP